MILISSHRPHSEGGEFPRNQILAHKTWEAIARKIIYFGPAEQDLTGSTTHFIPSEQFPRIMDMAMEAGRQPQVTALINADIVLTQGVLKVEWDIKRNFTRAAISRRYHFDANNPNLDLAEDNVADRGRDIFITTPRIWRQIAAHIPPVYRIGHQKWDAWVSDYFRDTQGRFFTDFTRLRCVFHPNHGERKMPHSAELEDARG